MSKLEEAIRDLVIGNRILAREQVIDAYGQVSTRHPLDPDRYLLSRWRSPEHVEPADIMEFTFDGKPIGDDRRPAYLERFIDGAIYEARPDVEAVVHSHAEAILPFGITATPLRPVTHMGAVMGPSAPVWDISDKFGDAKLLVTNPAQGRDLALALGQERVVLMRGHGFAAAAPTLKNVVEIAIYTLVNARVLKAAMPQGEVKGLSPREIAACSVYEPEAASMWRAWEHWARRAGCGDRLPTHSGVTKRGGD